MARQLRAFALLAVAGMMLAACNPQPVVGVLLPLSGDAAAYGEAIESGARLAFEDARKKGNLPDGFSVYWADTESDPATAVELLRQQIKEHKVVMILGGATSAEARAILPVLEKRHVVCLSPSASAPGLGEESKYFYRIYPSDELEGSRAAQFVHDELKKANESQRVIVYAPDTEYARGIAGQFKNTLENSFDAFVVGTVAIDQDGWEERSAELLRKERPHAAYVVAYAHRIVEVLKHLRKQRFNGLIMTTSAFAGGDAISENKRVAEGVYLLLPPFDRTTNEEPTATFVSQYMDTYTRAPDIYAAHGFDAMNVIIEVMSTVERVDPSSIRQTLQFGLQEYHGVTGVIQFNDYGDVVHYPTTFVISGGKPVSYDSFKEVEKKRARERMRQLQEELRRLAGEQQ